jgi:hypothetical protein
MTENSGTHEALSKRPAARSPFYAGIFSSRGELLGHVPLFDRQAGAFEPVLSEYELATRKDLPFDLY